MRLLWKRLVHKMTTRIDSGVSFALDRGSLIGLDCPQRLGKLSQAEVTQGKLLKAQSRELHFDGRKHLSEMPTFRPCVNFRVRRHLAFWVMNPKSVAPGAGNHYFPISDNPDYFVGTRCGGGCITECF